MFTAPAVAQVNLTVHKEVLPNGLTVLLHPNKQAPTVSCRLFYVTGSVHEVPGKSGLAHILEHELFKGTKKESRHNRQHCRRQVYGHSR